MVFDVAQELVARGHAVRVITTAPFRRVSWGVELSHEKNVRVYRVFHWNLFFTLHSAHHALPVRLCALVWSLVNVPCAYHVAKIIRAEQPDVVHTHNLAGMSFLIPWMVRRARVAHMHTLHDVQLAIPSGRLCVGDEFAWVHRGIAARVYQWIQKKLWGSPAVVTAPSEWLAHYYHTRRFFPRSKIAVVRHNFGAPHSHARMHAVAKSHVRTEPFTILYVGQIERAKGVRMLVQIFSDAWTRGEAHDAELLLVGSGSDSATVRTLASACPVIHVVGELAHDRIASVMRASDVVAVPSLLYENSPTVVSEALCAGRPVSVSDVGGAAELVRACNGGWVVAPHEDAWRAHIHWLLHHRAVVGRTHISYTGDHAVDLFEALYRDLTQRQMI